jgi:hypothetical protein
VKNTSNSIGYQNGLQVLSNSNNNSFSSASTATGQLLVGSADFDRLGGFINNFTGKIGEIIVYKTALSDADRILVQTYLAKKWNLPMVCATIPVTAGISYTTKAQGFSHNEYLTCDTSGYNSSVQVNCQNYGGQATINGSCYANNCTFTTSNANTQNIDLASSLLVLSGSTSSVLACKSGYNGSPTISCTNGVISLNGSCQKNTCSVANVVNSLGSTSLTHNDTVFCAAGYTANGASLIANCNGATGSITGGSCSAVSSCSVSSDTLGGKIIGFGAYKFTGTSNFATLPPALSKTAIDSSYNIVCSDGYVGTPSYICDANFNLSLKGCLPPVPDSNKMSLGLETQDNTIASFGRILKHGDAIPIWND